MRGSVRTRLYCGSKRNLHVDDDFADTLELRQSEFDFAVHGTSEAFLQPEQAVAGRLSSRKMMWPTALLQHVAVLRSISFRT